MARVPGWLCARTYSGQKLAKLFSLLMRGAYHTPMRTNSLRLPGHITMSCAVCGHQKRKARAGKFPAGHHSARRLFLFDFDVIAGVNIRGTDRNYHRRRVTAYIEHDSLAKNLAGQVIPFVALRRASKAVDHELIILGLRHSFRVRSLVAEDAKVIANLDPLVGSQVYVHGAVFSKKIDMVFSAHDHGYRLAADRRKMIEFFGVLIGRGGTLFVWQQVVASLHVVAGEDYLCNGNLGLHINDTDLAGVQICGAHRLH